MTEKCPDCGNALRSELGEYDFRGLPSVHLVDVERLVCDECGFGETVIPSPLNLSRELARVLIEKSQPLTGSEVRFLRKHAGWSGKDFARVMGVTAETVSRWENDNQSLGTVADRLVRLLIASAKKIEDYEAYDRLNAIENVSVQADIARFGFINVDDMDGAPSHPKAWRLLADGIRTW